jgi:hypothetical protein
MATITITPGNSFTATETVTSTKLNDLGSPTAALTAASIDTADIADDAITTPAILDSSVTFAKLTDVIDDDTMATATDTTTATSESIKAYVDSVTTITQTTGTAPYYGCRAFGAFDGTAATPITPISSGNIASIVRTATGVYKVTLTTAMPSADYCVIANEFHNVSVSFATSISVTITDASTFYLNTGSSGVPFNSTYIAFSVFA